MGGWETLFLLLLVSMPVGLAFARFWARSVRHGQDERPRVPPGDPGNPA